MSHLLTANAEQIFSDWSQTMRKSFHIKEEQVRIPLLQESMIPVIMRNDPSLAVRTLVVSSGSTVGGRSNELNKVDTWGMMAWCDIFFEARPQLRREMENWWKPRTAFPIYDIHGIPESRWAGSLWDPRSPQLGPQNAM